MMTTLRCYPSPLPTAVFALYGGSKPKKIGTIWEKIVAEVTN
jgi:hypothetical protein